MSEAILDEVRRTPEEEVCGLLVGAMEGDRVRVLRIVACENIEPIERRQNRFSIDPREIIQTERALRGTEEAVVGFYHSHPFSDAVPSGVDRTFMELWPEALWLIVEQAGKPTGGGVRGWVWEPEAPRRVREVGFAKGTE